LFKSSYKLRRQDHETKRKVKEGVRSQAEAMQPVNDAQRAVKDRRDFNRTVKSGHCPHGELRGRCFQSINRSLKTGHNSENEEATERFQPVS